MSSVTRIHAEPPEPAGGLTPEQKAAIAEHKRALVEAMRNPDAPWPPRLPFWPPREAKEEPRPKQKLTKRQEAKLATSRRRRMILAAQQRHHLWEEAQKKGRHLYCIDGGLS